MSAQMLSAGKGALFLTAVGTLSQLLGFGYRVILSRLVGAEVMGLYQLLMSAHSVLLSLTAVGLTSAVSNLTSQHLALGNRLGADQTLHTCLRLFLLLLLPLGAFSLLASDWISVTLLGDARTRLGIMLLVPCAALTGVENLHKQAFYGAGLIVPPALVDLAEQLVRAAAVLGLLVLLLPQYPERAAGLIVAGMVVCEVFSACTLTCLYRRRNPGPLSGPGEAAPVRRRRIAAIALPVGANALLGNWLGAANSTLLPQKLVRGGMERSAAMSQLGVVCGMTMPMLALPTVFLGALNLILVPRLARAAALGRPGEVRRLVGRALSVVALLALPSMSVMAVLGPDLGLLLFGREDVGRYLIPLTLTMLLSCFCSVLAATLNGIGRQKAVAAVSLLGGGLQLLCTLTLVPIPGVGMGGYAFGALLATALETGLCLLLVIRHTGLIPALFPQLIAPGLSSLLAALNANLLLRYLKDGGLPLLPAVLIALLFALILYLAALSAQGIRLRELFPEKW